MIIYELDFNQNYYTFTSIVLMKIVLCSNFSWPKFINYDCFDMKSSKAHHFIAFGQHKILHEWTIPVMVESL